jgi:hypothetical protein
MADSLRGDAQWALGGVSGLHAAKILLKLNGETCEISEAFFLRRVQSRAVRSKLLSHGY